MAHISSLAQVCSNSIANALDLQQSYTKSLIYASVNLVSINSGIDLLHSWLRQAQAISWTYVDFWSIGP